jgi:hypothetical protein
MEAYFLFDCSQSQTRFPVVRYMSPSGKISVLA